VVGVLGSTFDRDEPVRLERRRNLSVLGAIYRQVPLRLTLSPILVGELHCLFLRHSLSTAVRSWGRECPSRRTVSGSAWRTWSPKRSESLVAYSDNLVGESASAKRDGRIWREGKLFTGARE